MNQETNTAVPTVLYSRYQDGARPVQVAECGGQRQYILEPEAPKPLVFDSARSLLIALTGHPRARNWTHDRYFRQGRYAPSATRVHPTIPWTNTTLRDTTPAAGITILPSRRLGIDLVNRSGEVAKLLFAGYGPRIFGAGYDPDDVLQEVYKGLLARNRGTCPWDERKSSFGHYVHMVCGCVLSNYYRKQKRHRDHERLGVAGFEGDSLGTVDVGSDAAGASLPREPVQEGQQSPVRAADDLRAYIQTHPRGNSTDGRLAALLVPYVNLGYTRSEMADLMGTSKAAVSRALTFLRAVARQWAMRN